MRPTPAALFVLGALALVGGMCLFEARDAHGADDDGPAVPKDAAGFGFVVRTQVGGVALLESTRPFSLALTNGPVHGVPPSTEHYDRAEDEERCRRGAHEVILHEDHGSPLVVSQVV